MKSIPRRTANVNCEFWFEASHQLSHPEWSEEENDRVFGKCIRLHGHSYHLKVSARGPIDPETGMVINFFDLKQAVRERILDWLDHRHLNDVLDVLPTAENVVWRIAERLVPALEGVQITRIELWETRSACAFLDEADLEALR